MDKGKSKGSASEKKGRLLPCYCGGNHLGASSARCGVSLVRDLFSMGYHSKISALQNYADNLDSGSQRPLVGELPSDLTGPRADFKGDNDTCAEVFFYIVVWPLSMQREERKRGSSWC